MSERVVFVNGSYCRESEASVSVFDRGFLFADAVYEVSTVLNGRLVDNEAHLLRLERSLSELRISSPVNQDELISIQKELIERNGLKEGIIYTQVSRGCADRDFPFPIDAKPSLIILLD